MVCLQILVMLKINIIIKTFSEKTEIAWTNKDFEVYDYLNDAYERGIEYNSTKIIKQLVNSKKSSFLDKVVLRKDKLKRLIEDNV